MHSKCVYYFCLIIMLLLFSNQLIAQTWAKTYGGDADFSIAIIAGYDETYTVAGRTGSYGSDFWIMNIDKFGNILWQKSYGGNDFESVYSIQKTLDGGYIVAGDTTSFGAGHYSFWVIKIDKNGEIIWQNSYGGDQNDEPRSIVVTKDNSYVIAGGTELYGEGYKIWLIKIDKNGEIVWQKSYNVNVNYYTDNAQDIILTSDGGYVIAGYTFRGPGDSTVWISRLDSDGNILWEKSYALGKGEWGKSIIETNDGGFLVAGYTGLKKTGGIDIWLLKLNASGDIIWQKAYGGDDDEEVYSIVATPDGGYIIGGNTKSFGAGAWDILLFKIDNSGNIIWQKTFGSEYLDALVSMVPAVDGGYIISGFNDWKYLLDFDVSILKITEDGNIEGACSYFHEAKLKVINTNATVTKTSAKVRNTNYKRYPTNGKAREISAVVDTICSSPIIDISCRPATLPFLLRMSKCSIKPNYGYSATIYLSCAGLPLGAMCKFSPDVIVPIGNLSLETTLTVEITNVIKEGIYPFQIVASNGAVSSTFNMNLKINK